MSELAAVVPSGQVTEAAYLSYLATVRYLAFQQHGRSVDGSGFAGAQVASAFGLDPIVVTDRVCLAGCLGPAADSCDGQGGIDQGSGIETPEEGVSGQVPLDTPTDTAPGCPDAVQSSGPNTGFVPSGPDLTESNDVESKLDRNRRWRKEKKERKARKQNRGHDSRRDMRNDQSSLRSSLEAKWLVENERKRVEGELAMEKARRELEILRATSLEDETRRRVTMVKRHTEANMAAIEKTHKFLSKTGNVAGEPAGGLGFAETIVSGCPDLSSGSISPDSSASMQEFRAVQKQCLDLQREVDLMRKAFVKSGGNLEAIDLYGKSVFTMEDGTIAQRYVDRFNELNLSWGIPHEPYEMRGSERKTKIDFYGERDENAFYCYDGDC